jgi:peptide/nickel transport system substrate-binding protein
MATLVWARGTGMPAVSGTGVTRRDLFAIAAFGLVARASALAQAAGPTGQLNWGVHTTLAPTWFDPAETPGIITPFMMMYALHDALVKPMPGNAMSPSLAESFSVSEDALTVDFMLRSGTTFHNGEPVTAEDVKFSFERYKGASATLIKDGVASVETLDKRHVRFRLKEPWPDFLTYYASASGAGWIVPKKYVESVGAEGFKRTPIGAGPYRFISFTPGVELLMEVYEGYWRKVPNVKRIAFKVIPDETTRLAALKRGEVDIVYAMNGELAKEVRATPGLTLKPVYPPGPFWLYFPEQWDPNSPWHDERVRRAANLAIDRKTINDALTLGFSKLTNSIIPDMFDFSWKAPEPVFDRAKAKELLAQAGHPNGFDAGEYYCDSSWANLGETVVDNLRAAGIRARLRPLERAAFFEAYGNKKLKNIIQGASGAFGNAATRLAAFVVKGGAYVYGSYPELDELFKKQAIEIDPKRRETILHKMQQIVHEKAIYAPIWQLAFMNAHGPRVGESGFGLIPAFAYTGPYEDITIKGT